MRSLTTCAVFTLFSLIAVSPAQQNTTTAIPNLINYSGTLLEAGGEALASRTVGVTFVIYRQQEGGAPIWLETQNVTPDSTGHFTVQLGSTRAEGVPAELFANQEQRWLGVQVQEQPEQARVLLVSVPYAFKAHEAETLSGHEAGEFITTDSLRSAVQQLQQTPASSNGTLTYTPNPTSALGQPVTTDGATNFVDTTSNQVVLVQQKGTGVALNATAGGNSAITGKSTTGAVAAVAGTSSSSNGTGISGTASATTGANYGVKGQSSSTSGTGVSATASATTGTTVGVNAQVSSAGGRAAILQNTASGNLISARTGVGTGTEKFRVDGSGNVTTAGNLSGNQLISRVAAGTSPLQVTSNTQVPNLNASLLGGNSASAFAPASGSPNYIQNGTTTQKNANFDIDGNGTVGGTLTVMGAPIKPVNHARETISYTGGQDTIVTLAWAFAFPDTQYTATCSPEVSGGLLNNGGGIYQFQITNAASASIDVQVIAVASGTVTIHCSAVHD